MKHTRPSALIRFTLVCGSLIVLYAPSLCRADFQTLNEKYREIEDELTENSYGIPLYIQSRIEAQSQHGDVYGIIYHPLDKVKKAFSQAANWCEIAPLHLNIKACTYQKLNGNYQVVLYSGRKFFEKLEDTHKLVYQYKAENGDDNYTRANLSAEDGPLGTSNYNITTEAIPLDDASTFIHFSYSYNQGFWTRMAMKTYLATLGRNKVGFTIIDTDFNEQPVYIAGVRGVIERNAMRYYFAIQSFLETGDKNQQNSFHARLERWFDLTEQHHTQLYEMDKKEYLDYKQKERIEQTRLQAEIGK
jgi:hypothetical protein